MKRSKITFLGIGGDSYIVGKQILSSGGIIIQLDNTQFHIDPGPGALIKAKQYDINLRENTALLVSHAHINHSNDANAVIAAMTHNGDDKRGVLITNKTAMHGDEKINPIITQYHKNCVEKYIIMEKEKKIGVDNIDILATPAKHSDQNAIGFKFFTKEFTLSYVGDTSLTKDIANAHKNSDIIILNIKNPGNIKKKEDMNTDDAIKFLNIAKPSLAIITHFGIKMVSQDPINEARTIQKETKVQVIAAKDGMTINPLSYNASIKQKTLNSY